MEMVFVLNKWNNNLGLEIYLVVRLSPSCKKICFCMGNYSNFKFLNILLTNNSVKVWLVLNYWHVGEIGMPCEGKYVVSPFFALLQLVFLWQLTMLELNLDFVLLAQLWYDLRYCHFNIIHFIVELTYSRCELNAFGKTIYAINWSIKYSSALR